MEKVRNTLRDIVESHLPDIFLYNENYILIEQLLEQAQMDFIDRDLFKKYLFNSGYCQYKKYIGKKKMPLSALYSFIVKEYFPRGISVYETQQIQRVRSIMKQKFGYSNLPSSRAISARITSVTVLCDKGKYISPEHIDIPLNLVEQVKTYILNYPGDSLLIADVFHKFQVKLTRYSNVDNKYFLHGVLRYYFEDELIFSRDLVGKKHANLKSSHIILEDYLKERHCPVSKQEIRHNYPGFSDSMVNNAVMFNPNIICWDVGNYIHISNLLITSTDKMSLKTILDEALSHYDGYTNAYILFTSLRNKMRDFLFMNKVTNPMNVFYILEYLFDKDYYFSRPHILQNKPEGRFTTTDLLRKYIENKGYVSFSQLIMYLSSLQLSEATLYSAMADLQEEMIQVSQDEYVLKSNFNVPNSALEAITAEINKRLETKGYIIINAIDDYFSFPLLEYPWTPYLLESIIRHYLKEFKLVEKDITDRRYITSVVVKKGLPIDSYVDLVKYILKNERLEGEFSSYKDMEEWLRKKGLIAKVIPKELLQCEAINLGDDDTVFINT